MECVTKCTLSKSCAQQSSAVTLRRATRLSMGSSVDGYPKFRTRKPAASRRSTRIVIEAGVRPSPCTTMTVSASASTGGERHPVANTAVATMLSRNGRIIVGNKLFRLY